MIQVYYGPGKGKTTAALGASVRALGADMSVLFISFLKDNSSSERQINTGITFYKNPEKIKFLKDMTESEKKEYVEWIEEAIDYASHSKADMIVFDEMLDVTYLICDKIKNFTFEPNKEYIITGHIKNEYIFSLADYITFFQKERHPYDKNVQARRGIEY